MHAGQPIVRTGSSPCNKLAKIESTGHARSCAGRWTSLLPCCCLDIQDIDVPIVRFVVRRPSKDHNLGSIFGCNVVFSANMGSLALNLAMGGCKKEASKPVRPSPLPECTYK